MAEHYWIDCVDKEGVARRLGQLFEISPDLRFHNDCREKGRQPKEIVEEFFRSPPFERTVILLGRKGSDISLVLCAKAYTPEFPFTSLHSPSREELEGVLAKLGYEVLAAPAKKKWGDKKLNRWTALAAKAGIKTGSLA